MALGPPKTRQTTAIEERQSRNKFFQNAGAKSKSRRTQIIAVKVNWGWTDWGKTARSRTREKCVREVTCETRHRNERERDRKEGRKEGRKGRRRCCLPPAILPASCRRDSSLRHSPQRDSVEVARDRWISPLTHLSALPPSIHREKAT